MNPHCGIKLLVVLIFAILSIGINSCKKCIHCSYNYYENQASKTKEYTAEECGNSKDLKQFEENMQYAAEEFHDSAKCSSPY